MTAHPDDPQKPASVRGVSDEELSATSTDDVKELIQVALPYAEAHASQPRYLFGLGRAAYLHGDDDFAKELLTKASDHGSTIAKTYLAKLDAPASQYAATSTQSSGSGLIPSAGQAQHRGGALDFSKFKHGDIMQALYEGRLDYLRKNPLNSFAYLLALNEVVTDSSSVLFYVDDRDIVTVTDPSVSVALGRKLQASPQANEQAATAGLSTFWNALQAMANTRKNGGSVMDEVNATQQSFSNSSYMKLAQFKQEGIADGKRFALMFDSNRPAFERIYSSIRRFSNE